MVLFHFGKEFTEGGNKLIKKENFELEICINGAKFPQSDINDSYFIRCSKSVRNLHYWKLQMGI